MHGSSATFETKPSYCRVARQRLPCAGGGGGANEAEVDQTTERYFLLTDPFIEESRNT